MTMELITEGYYWIKENNQIYIGYYYKKGDHFRCHKHHQRIPFNSVFVLGKVCTTITTGECKTNKD